MRARRIGRACHKSDKKTHLNIMNIHKMTLVYPVLKLLIYKTSDPGCGRDRGSSSTTDHHTRLSWRTPPSSRRPRSRRIPGVKAVGSRYATLHARSITPPYLGPRSTGTRSVEPAQDCMCRMLRCEG